MGSAKIGSDPHPEYKRRIELRRSLAARHKQLDVRLGNLRLLIFIAGMAIAWLAYKSALISAWWLLLPGVGFLTLVILHEHVRRAGQRLERAMA